MVPGGIRINSESPLGDEDDLILTLPEEVLGEEASMKAQVVWQRELYGSSFLQGLAFAELSSAQQLLLKQKLERDRKSERKRGRQHYRLYRPFPIKLQANGEEGWQSSYATDLSIQGLGTRLSRSYNKDQEVTLRLELEFELPTVEVAAKVAWCSEGENGITHGLQFATVGPVEAKTIKRYIDRCLEFSPD